MFNNVNNSISEDILIASKFVKRAYLNNLNEYEVVPLEDNQKKFQTIRLYKVDKLIFDSNEDVNDKLVSVFNSVSNTKSNLIFILKGLENSVEFYLGVQSNREIGVADKVFKKSILGNFPGSSVERIAQQDVVELLENSTNFEGSIPNLTCLNVVPSIRNNKNNKDFIQGLEKYIDTMKGEEYTCILIAASISDDNCEERLKGYEQLYTALYPLSNTAISHGTSEGTTFTEGFNSSFSDSVSDGISKTTGTNISNSHSNGIHVGFLKAGFNHSNARTEGSSISEGTTHNTTKQETQGRNESLSKTENITDNVTVNYKDKIVEDTLEQIERRINRIKECMTFGMWECAAYFISNDLQTSIVAANAFKSLMLGEDNVNEKTFLNLFGMREQEATLNAIETLKYCHHPVFKIRESKSDQLITATEYLSGKELPLFFAMPRKSVSGITVTSMAEFGRNIIYTNDFYKNQKQVLKIGKISHMNQIEDTEVKLDLQSLTSHCFITGSTGSGKSNTTFTIINELLKPEINIPFLVVEPAKGEYKYAFVNVPGINIFTTSISVGRFLKINPFKFQSNIHILEHLDRLIEIFNTCWEMYAAMPAILKDAIERIYEKKGWDLLNSVYLQSGNPQYPTFKDLLAELPEVINNSSYSSDTKGDYIGALVTRVNSLTNGIIGQIFCDCYDVDDEELFDQCSIVDLSRVGSSETKSLIMGIIVLKLSEYRMSKVKANNSPLRHITILEEAHNLLKNTNNLSGSSNSIVSKSVEMICNSIAEMRTYGEGFILVDQSPSAVDIAAIKNTNTKIIMRLPEAGDCEAIGKSVSLNEKQIAELSKLKTGTAVVMQNNWCEAILSQINRYNYCYTGEIPSIDGKELLKFKSKVIGELLNEYTIKKTRSINKILEIIDFYEIDNYKKEDARCMVHSICNTLNQKWDSSYLGKALTQYTGLEILFKRAEQLIDGIPHHGQEITDKHKDSVDKLFSFLYQEIDKILEINEQQKRTIIQYMIYSKAYDKTIVDYDLIYRLRYLL